MTSRPTPRCDGDRRQQVITIDGTQQRPSFHRQHRYLKADAAALAGFIGAPADQVPELAGKWLSFSPGDTLGTTTTQPGHRDHAVIGGVGDEAAGPDTVTGPETVNGQSVLAVSSPIPASQKLPSSARMILYVTAGGSRR